MGLEVATTIAALDSSWPLGGDTINKGDDHIRVVKAVLKAIFPGAGAAGFATAILATEAELNYIQGLTSNAQTQLTANAAAIAALDAALTGTLSAPATTAMLFLQAAAPAGWTIVATEENRMLRLCDGTTTTGGATGGTDSPIDNTHDHTTPAHTLVEGEIPTHDHGLDGAGKYISSDGGETSWQILTFDGAGTQLYRSTDTDEYGGGGSHAHGNTGSDAWSPKYINGIHCTKDA